ncbi:dTDP-glucose 4,6-dehydratase [Streptomyces sp. SID14478]|uniref:dTDP-glucose 4,6-dehydratase n=1 Tax=Streptomyces sp. SID14478 TaxID=2706073 RepID=UPI0013DB6AB8|nr:dTDP-glucose 4,6-dehydratase [Streptomyces sp. SID14478]NEB75979.1 dTDP-glucose 4,6-dehydratase [Streptomyces sp. SID14478]
MHVLVTGGAGFIGSHFVHRMLKAPDVEKVTVLDALTYAGHRHNLADTAPALTFVHGNILHAPLIDRLMAAHDAVVHFAAESHVDRSYAAPGTFVSTNVMGTQILADAAARHDVTKFVHVSTDEVYGPLAAGRATEESPLLPTVPYAASKAASDLVALSFHRTYGLPVCVTRSSNNYGPRQYPEKVIPLFTARLLSGHSVTLHGSGRHVRNWLHVEDHCAGIEAVLRRGRPGEVYNLGGGTDLTGLQLAERLLALCGAGPDAITYIPDRQANDLRYAMDCSKAADELGYRPQIPFDAGLAETVTWYRKNPHRWAPILEREEFTRA